VRRTRLLFAIESGADVRLVEGLAERFDLTTLARRIEGGVEISWPPREGGSALRVGPPSRLGFARQVFGEVAGAGGRYDAVVVQNYGPAALAANLAARRRNLPVFMLVCSPVERYYLCRREHAAPGKRFRRAELLALRAFARANARAGRHYLVLSEHLAEVVRGHGGGRLPVSVVPVYGVDTGIFSPATEPRRAVRARLGLPESGALVFFSSRVAPEKDTETLLAAFRALLAEGRDLWLLHRSGAHRAFVRDAQRFGIAGRVVATDAVHPHEGLADDYRASDLCVQASREEGLGFSVLEALACETPVVASATGGLRDVVRDGETGWTYPVGDSDALARAVARALGDRPEAARRAARGRGMVRALYERRLVFDRFQAVIESAARGGSGG